MTNRTFRKAFKEATSVHQKRNVLDLYIKGKIAHTYARLGGVTALESAVPSSTQSIQKIIDFSGLDLRGLNLDDIFRIPLSFTEKRTHTYSNEGTVTVSTISYNIKFVFNFKNANLQGIKLAGALLDDANFKKAKLGKSDLSAASLVRANFEEANLLNANIEGTNLLHANFKNANLSGTNLHLAREVDIKHSDRPYLYGVPHESMYLSDVWKRKEIQEKVGAIAKRLQDKEPLKLIFMKLAEPQAAPNDTNFWLWKLDPKELRILYSLSQGNLPSSIKGFSKKHDPSLKSDLIQLLSPFALAIRQVNRDKIFQVIFPRTKFGQVCTEFKARGVPKDLIKYIFSFVGQNPYLLLNKPFLNKTEMKNWDRKFADENDEEKESSVANRKPQLSKK